MESKKQLHEREFPDLVDAHTRRIFDHLLTGGSGQMRAAIFDAMSVAIQWRQERDRKEKAQRVAEAMERIAEGGTEISGSQ